MSCCTFNRGRCLTLETLFSLLLIADVPKIIEFLSSGRFTGYTDITRKWGNVRIGDHPPGTHKTVRNLSWKRASGCSRQPKIMTRKIGEHWPTSQYRQTAVFRLVPAE